MGPECGHVQHNGGEADEESDPVVGLEHGSPAPSPSSRSCLAILVRTRSPPHAIVKVCVYPCGDCASLPWLASASESSTPCFLAPPPR